MAQVTEGLIAEWRDSIKRGYRPAITDNEFEQLLWAWEQWQARASLQGRELKCTRFVDMGDGSNCLRCGQGAAYHARREG